MGLLAAPARAVDDVVLHSFAPNDGVQPPANLINIGGVLYGTTYLGGTGVNNGGTVFKITTAGVFTVLHPFGNGTDGFWPRAGLTNVGGVLYGTTGNGGAYGYGTVFKITTAGVETVLHSFKGGSDGAYPYAALIDVGSVLYGTTAWGGTGCPGGCGTVYKITTAGVETVLYSFKGGSDGENPWTGLIHVGGVLYGTTLVGGTGHCSGGCGTVFKITTAGVETVLYSFKGGSDGTGPYAGLLDVGGVLYGTTNGGGTSHDGTVYKITTAGVETVLYSFKGGSDGNLSDAALINVGGVLYGTTYLGGKGHCKNGCGTVFKITTAGVETVLHSFNGSPNDGAGPGAGLLDVGGVLYGTTSAGGTFNEGTVYKVTP